ncbi:MAG: cation transporter [Saprospiraceae bacterium]|nr:cation transporter [Saprospiraceae bacterium]
MAHHHHHHHDHQPSADGRLTQAFAWGIGLNLVFVIIEVLVGFATGSLALLSDAGHNISDVGSLAISFFALRLARRRATKTYSYGFGKVTIWASDFNGLVLMLAMGGIGYEAIRRLAEPPQIPGFTVALVAGIGILINAFTAWLFHRDKDKDLNVRGAYLHLAADAAVSAGVVVVGLGMQWSGWAWLDPAISFVILGVIVWSTWGLLRESFRLALDGVPPKITPAEVREAARKLPGIVDIHHLHIWAMSTMGNALTAHLVLKDGFPPEQISDLKVQFRHTLEHLDIQHATLETEYESDECLNRECG